MVLAAAQERGGLPKRVVEEVRRYLACGDLRYGFTQAKCDTCQESVLIAFSCKSRGWCPSCAARRAHEAAAHLGAALPHVGYRQWTLSLPRALRWGVVKDAQLLRAVERCLTKAIFRWQRQRAKGWGCTGEPRCGAVSFTQLFNGHLALQPHLHLLVAEGVWSGGAFLALPPPDAAEVESVLARMLRQLRRVFEGMEPTWPEDAFEALQLEGAQLRLKLDEEPNREPRRRVAVGEGFSLHADTQVSGND
jgi:transposase-like zinc-binding protein